MICFISESKSTVFIIISKIFKDFYIFGNTLFLGTVAINSFR